MDTTESNPVTWGTRAERLLAQAFAGALDGIDVIPDVEAALTALRIEAGELPAHEMDGYPFPGEASGATCICPPGLVERGGFRGGCPVHHTRY